MSPDRLQKVKISQFCIKHAYVHRGRSLLKQSFMYVVYFMSLFRLFISLLPTLEGALRQRIELVLLAIELVIGQPEARCTDVG